MALITSNRGLNAGRRVPTADKRRGSHSSDVRWTILQHDGPNHLVTREGMGRALPIPSHGCKSFKTSAAPISGSHPARHPARHPSLCACPGCLCAGVVAPLLARRPVGFVHVQPLVNLAIRGPLVVVYNCDMDCGGFVHVQPVVTSGRGRSFIRTLHHSGGARMGVTALEPIC